jgi:hypothetical protein
MADFTRNSVADMAAGNPGINMGTSGSMKDIDWGDDREWPSHDAHWRLHYGSRPYAHADRGYEHYAPAYRYGTAAAAQYAGRDWSDAERDLERGWERARGASTSTWADMKDAVRDAWDRVRGHR